MWVSGSCTPAFAMRTRHSFSSALLNPERNHSVAMNGEFTTEPA